MNWKRVTHAMLESDDRVFQISRAPVIRGQVTYRAWRRATNDVLLAMTVDDTPEDRARAVERCKQVCEAAAVPTV